MDNRSSQAANVRLKKFMRWKGVRNIPSNYKLKKKRKELLVDVDIDRFDI